MPGLEPISISVLHIYFTTEWYPMLNEIAHHVAGSRSFCAQEHGC